MERRLVAAAATGVAMVLLVVAASSGPVRVWITPSVDVGPSPIGDAGPLETIAPLDSVPPEPGDPNNLGNTILELIGVVLIVLVVTLAASFVRIGKWTRPRRRGVGQRRDREVTALPEVAERELEVDVDAARVALAGGSPRNAIV